MRFSVEAVEKLLTKGCHATAAASYILVLTFWVSVHTPGHAQEIPLLQGESQTSKTGKEDEQMLPSTERSRLRTSRERYMEELRQSKSLTEIVTPSILSHPIDPTQYVLGPGDVLQLALMGELELSYPLTVLPEGTISIPAVGVIPVAEETLLSARHKVREALSRSFRKFDFTLDLLQLRKFRVYVTGEVRQPGTYFAQEQDRVSDVVELAGGATAWADTRRIELRHADSTKEAVDLQGFYRTGQFAGNPRVGSGDIIQVHAVSPTQQFVIIENINGAFEFLPIHSDESLYSFLQNNLALSRAVNLNNIEIIRDGEIISQNYLSDQNGHDDFVLRHQDRIRLAKVADKVYIEGAVQRPGPQQFSPNLRAVDYAGLAGLMSNSGHIDRLKVIRADGKKAEYGRDVIVERGDIVVVPRSRREVVRDYVEIVGTLASIFLTIALTQTINR